MVDEQPQAKFSEVATEGCIGETKLTPLQRRKAKRKRLPKWFRTSLPVGESQSRFNLTKSNVHENKLHTVCEEARCPNVHDCWGRGTATFMIAGKECTRSCRFCAVGTIKAPPPLDTEEPAKLAEAVKLMGVTHAVITVVNRDDLSDGGADHFKKCIQAVRERCPEVKLEFLCSDLDGNLEALGHLLHESPLSVFAHNVECVPRLDKNVRDSRASFSQSLTILKEAKRLRPDILTKSSLMVGIGETDQEIDAAMQQLRDADVDIITIGQYLQPSWKHLSVDRFPTPEQFAAWDNSARELGFSAVASGPLVRSSYRAGPLLNEANGGEPVATLSTEGAAYTYLPSSPSKDGP